MTFVPLTLKGLICLVRGHDWEWVEREMGGLAWSIADHDIDWSECQRCHTMKGEPCQML